MQMHIQTCIGLHTGGRQATFLIQEDATSQTDRSLHAQTTTARSRADCAPSMAKSATAWPQTRRRRSSMRIHGSSKGKQRGRSRRSPARTTRFLTYPWFCLLVCPFEDPWTLASALGALASGARRLLLRRARWGDAAQGLGRSAWGSGQRRARILGIWRLPSEQSPAQRRVAGEREG